MEFKPNVSSSSVSDENVMVKQIEATHAPDGRDVDARPLLYLVEDILNRATDLNPDAIISTGTQTHIESLEEMTHQSAFLAMLDSLSYTIDRISCEISYKASAVGGSGTDAHQTTLSIFNMLTNYVWDAKLMLALTAFALHYGEFWILTQIYSTNQLVKSVVPHLPIQNVITEQASELKPGFDALNILIKAILEVTQCVVEFKQLPFMYITPDVPALSSANIPAAVYWTIRSIVVCATKITSFTGYEFVISTTEAWDLSTLAHKLKDIHDLLKKQLEMCHQYIEEKRDEEAYQTLNKLIFEMIHFDNMRVLKALIYPRDDLQPLVHGSTKKRVNLDVLRRKNVLLLISGLDISEHDELDILQRIYEYSLETTTQKSQYEFVWIPVVDRSIEWTDPMQERFELLKSIMRHYWVQHPSLIGKASVKFIKEKWHFRNKPIIVVLDPQGKVVSPNAIHMMWIWLRDAFPFTSSREEALWREETWRLELLFRYGLHPKLDNWMEEGKYIFLFGGDDIEWIRKFTHSARAVALAARIPLEMFHVGRSSEWEEVKHVIATIELEKLSYVWNDQFDAWFFWNRLESMLLSKKQLGKADDHLDPVTLGLKKLLSYDREGAVWAVLGKGSSVVVNGHGKTVLRTLLEYETWKANVELQGFDVAFKNHHDHLLIQA